MVKSAFCAVVSEAFRSSKYLDLKTHSTNPARVHCYEKKNWKSVAARIAHTSCHVQGRIVIYFKISSEKYYVSRIIGIQIKVYYVN